MINNPTHSETLANAYKKGSVKGICLHPPTLSHALNPLHPPRGFASRGKMTEITPNQGVFLSVFLLALSYAHTTLYLYRETRWCGDLFLWSFLARKNPLILQAKTERK